MRMTKDIRKKCTAWIEGNVPGPLRGLAGVYWQQPLVLYTGCGVSTCPVADKDGRPYGLPTWFPLLKQLSGAAGDAGWPDDPWQAADRAVRLCGGRDAFKRRLRGLIRSEHNYRGYGQLRGPFVKHAHTLRALAAFCGQITGRKTNPGEREPRFVHFRTGPNPRVQAVLTSNYDCFLEAAGSNLYRKSPLKPVTALGALAGSLSRIPVFHIHGYVPHPLYQDEAREQAVEELVITREDYEKYWNPQDVFGTTMAPQIHYLRYFTVLFVGFSFTDEFVCKLMRRIQRDDLSRAGRTHFAFLQEGTVRERGEAFFEDLGVTPIAYERHEEIPDLLGQVYQAGLALDRIAARDPSWAQVSLPELLVKEFSSTGRAYRYALDDIWKVMQACSNESVPVSLVRGLESLAGFAPP